MATKENVLSSPPEGFELTPEGKFLYTGVQRAPAFSSEPPSFDARLRRYYGEDMRDSYNPLNPIIRGLKSTAIGEAAGITGFGEIATDSDYLQNLQEDLSKSAAKIPTRSFFEDVVPAAKRFELSEIGGFVGESLGSMVGFLAPYAATMLFPEPSSTVAGAGALGTRILSKVGTVLGVGAKTKKGRFARSAITGGTLTASGRQQKSIRDITGQENRGLALASGILQGQAERLPLSALFKSRAMGKNTYRSWLGAALGGGGVTGAAEAGTELVQEALSMGTDKVAAELADVTYDLLTPNNAIRLVDAAASGFAGGAPLGAIGAVGNYTQRDPSPEEDADLVKKASESISLNRDSILDQGRIATFNGLADALGRELQNKERMFSREELGEYSAFLEDLDNPDIIKSDKTRNELKQKLQPLIDEVKIKVLPEQEVQVEKSEIEKSATDLVKSAQQLTGIDLEEESNIELVEEDVRKGRQLRVDSATIDQPMTSDLAPYKQGNADLDYRAAFARGAAYMHETEKGEFPAIIKEIDQETGVVTRAEGPQGVVLLDKEGPAYTIQQIQAANTDRKELKPRSTPEEIRQVLADVRGRKALEAKLDKEQQKIRKQMGQPVAIEGPEKVSPEKLQALARAPKVPASIARNVPAAMLKGAAERAARLEKQRAEKPDYKKKGLGLKESKKPEQVEDVVEQPVAETKPSRTRRARVKQTGTRKETTKTSKQKPKTEQQPTKKVTLKVQGETVQADVTESDAEQLEALSKSMADRGKRIEEAGRKIVSNDGTQMMIFLPRLNFENLQVFIRELVGLVGDAVQYSIKYLSITLKRDPKKNEIISEYQKVYEEQLGSLVGSYASQNKINPAQLKEFASGVLEYFESKRKDNKYKGKSLAFALSDIASNINEAELFDWISNNHIQFPRGAESYGLGQSLTLINNSIASRREIAGDENDSVVNLSEMTPEDSPSASTLYAMDGSTADSVVLFKVADKKLSISIQAVDANGKMTIAYKLKDKIAKTLTTENVNNEKNIAYVYLPYDVVWNENGEFRSENFDRTSRKTKYSFAPDMPHTHLDRSEFVEIMSKSLRENGSEGFAKMFSQFELYRPELAGFIELARKHQALDSSKTYKPTNRFKSDKPANFQIASQTAKEMAELVIQSTEAVADRFIQDHNNALNEADSLINKIIKGDIVRGEGYGRLSFLDDFNFRSIVDKQQNHKTNKPLTEVNGVKLEGKFDYLLHYIKTATAIKATHQRRLTPAQKAASDISDTRKNELREVISTQESYIRDATQVLKKFQAIEKSGRKYEPIYDYKDKKRLKVNTVGLVPKRLDEATRQMARQVGAYLASSETERKRNAHTIFPIINGLYFEPIKQYSEIYNREIPKLVSEDVSEKIAREDTAQDIQSATYTEEKGYQDTRSEDVPSDDEMERMSNAEKQDAEFSAKTRELKTRLGRARRAYRDLLNDPNRTMDQLIKAHAEMVLNNDLVSYEIYDGLSNDTLYSASELAGESAIDQLRGILDKYELLPTEQDRNAKATFSPVSKKFGKLIKALFPLEIPDGYKDFGKKKKELSALKTKFRQGLEEENEKGRNRNVSFAFSDDLKNKLSFSKASKETFDDLLKEVNDEFSAREDQVLDQEIIDSYADKYESQMLEELMLEFDYEQEGFAGYEKRKNLREDLLGAIGLSYGTGRRQKRLVDFINKTFDVGEKRDWQELYQFAALEIGLADDFKSQLKKVYDDQQDRGIDITAYKILSRFISFGTASKTSKGVVADFAKDIKKEVFKNELRTFVKGRKFRANLDSIDLFSQMLKLNLQFNDDVISERYYQAGIKDPSKLPAYALINNSEQTPVHIFARLKTLMENSEDVMAVFDTAEWKSVLAFNSPRKVEQYYNEMLKANQQAKLNLGDEPKLKRNATAQEVAQYNKEIFAWNRQNERISDVNNVIRLDLLSMIVDDTVQMTIKQTGMSKKLFRTLMKIDGPRAQDGRQQSITNALNELIKTTREAGAYDLQPAVSQSVRGRGAFSGANLRNNLINHRYEGAFTRLAVLFESHSARQAMPRDFLTTNGRDNFTYRKGKVSSVGKMIGSPEGQTADPDSYRIIDQAVGAKAIKDLLTDYSNVLPEDMVNEGMEFLNSIPEEYFRDLTFEIAEDIVSDQVRLKGSFFETEGRVRAAVNLASSREAGADTVAHELAHSTYDFLNDKEISNIESLRISSLKKLINGAGTQQQAIIADKILGDFNGNISTTDFYNKLIRGMFPDGTTVPDGFKSAINSIYPLINGQEYFTHMMTNEGKVAYFDTLPSHHQGIIGKMIQKARDIFSAILNYLTGKKGLAPELKKDILDKFNSGEFRSRRQSLKPKVHGKFEYKYEVEKAIETDYREGQNKAAAQLIVKEASAASKLITSLIEDALSDLSTQDKYKGLLLNEKGELDPSKRISVATQLKRNKEIQQYLEEFETLTGESTFSPQTYLDMNEKDMPQSVWEQVSRNAAINFEFLVRGYQKLLDRSETFKTDAYEQETARLIEDMEGKHVDSAKLKASVKEGRNKMLELLKQGESEGKRNGALKLLESFGFSLQRLRDQINDAELGQKLNDVMRDIYGTITLTEEGRAALFEGRVSNAKTGELTSKTTWQRLIKIYRDNLQFTDPAKAKNKATPMQQFAAWNLLTIHDLDRKQMGISDEILQQAEISSEQYFQDMYKKGGSAKIAMSKLISDYSNSVRKGHVAAKLFLSSRKELANRIKKQTETELATEVLGSVIESEQFVEARKRAVDVIEMRPDAAIKYDGTSYTLPHPIAGQSKEISTQLDTKEFLESQLVEIDAYLASLDKWIHDPKNKDDVFMFFWKDFRNHVSTLMNDNSTRRGQVSQRSKILSLGKVGEAYKQWDAFLADVGGYPARLSRQLLSTADEAKERAEDWRQKHAEKMQSLIFAAAKSHGYEGNPIGVALWKKNVKKKYFAYANKTGRLLNVGDEIFYEGQKNKITKEDEAALKYQAKAINELYDLNMNKLRGSVAESRKVSDKIRGTDEQFIRKPLKTGDITLPKTFESKSVVFANQIDLYMKAIGGLFKEINERNLPESVTRQLKLSIYKEARVGKESLYDVLANQWDFIEAFLDDRSGKITSGTNPYFTEKVYDEARDKLFDGEITNLEDLADHFAKNSVKIDEDAEGEANAEDNALSRDEALYELLREMVFQVQKVHQQVSPADTRGKSDNIKITVLNDKNSFNTARQEPIANYYFYDYGVSSTPEISKIVADSYTQYLDEFVSSLNNVKQYLRNAAAELNKNIEGFDRKKRDEALSGENYIKYDTLKTDINQLETLTNLLEGIQQRDQRFEQQMFSGVGMLAFNDLTAAALMSSTTGIRNLIGTPTRTNLRLQSIFGFSFRINAYSIVNLGKALLELGGRTAYGLGAGLGYGAVEFAKSKGSRTRSAMRTFLTKAFDEAWTKEITIGQFKLNGALSHIAERGYGIRRDTGFRFDNWWESPETRGRIEREDDLKRRRDKKFGKLRMKAVEYANKASFVLVETGTNYAPRMFDMTGNNISYRQANVVAKVLDTRLKKMHDTLGSELIWKMYNEPNKAFDMAKLEAIKPEHLFANGFLFKANETNMKNLEDLFIQAGLDFHKEALSFLRQLDTDKNASFLSDDATGRLGIALFAENTSTIGSRSLDLTNNPDKQFIWRLFGWSFAAFHNSNLWLSRSIKGNPKWWSRDGLRFQQFLAISSFLTMGAMYYGGGEELIRMLKMLLYGEVASNKHPWEEDGLRDQAAAWAQYAMASFPIANIPVNMVSGVMGSSPKATTGTDLFFQSILSKISGYVSGWFQTGDPLYRIDATAKSIFSSPLHKGLIDLVSPVAVGHKDITNNGRLISTYAEKEFRKERRYSGGGYATPVTPHIRNLVGYAAAGDWDSFKKERTKAIQAAVEMEKEDPIKYVQQAYWGKDPWRTNLKGTISLGMRENILKKVESGYGKSTKDDFLETERNFNRGYILLGGTPNRFSSPSISTGGVSLDLPRRTRRKGRGAEFDTRRTSGVGRLRRSNLRKVYGV